MTIFLAAAVAAKDKRPPYWASIASGEAMMRTGPGRNYPGIWLYKRRDLPVRVIQVYPNWRKIEDPDGQQGWMLVTLLSDRRTAVIKPGGPRDIHAKRDANSPVRYRAEAGVVGRIEKCDGSWCKLQVGKREGFIAQGDLWGTGESELID
ncbi:SH3 domain-containing protein [Sphingomonas sp. RB56-2]|uniref:SH3 domain-containing protein n=1 Tax=Sphingomonas brevis TaxID=2908206 RepID=A0ABT0S8Q7_9SPHN|nr:SH3 domain-containing protein [Sphingomonas brevis]MCL6740775.1 SH3 domain-containing protein [Sphingomonas brevis]